METSREITMTDERLDSLERWRDEVEAKWKAAFPNGDYVGHCAYHDLMIDAARDRKKLIAAVKEKTISGLVWAGILFVGLAILSYLKSFFTKGGA